MTAQSKDPARIAAMFDGVAPGYDRVNTVVSFGLDRHWRRATREALVLTAGERCLDVAAGTGVSTVELARSGADVVGVDFSVGMLAAGRERWAMAGVPVTMIQGDALDLPFDDAEFDAVTISFGLRNVADPAKALGEMARVARRGGRLVVCEFSHPIQPQLRRAYLRGLGMLPPVARWFTGLSEMVRPARSARHDEPANVHGNPANVHDKDDTAYRYLVDSIRDWPPQRALARVMTEAGWQRVAWHNLTGGVVALHRGFR